jgi:hypothetical protein
MKTVSILLAIVVGLLIIELARRPAEPVSETGRVAREAAEAARNAAELSQDYEFALRRLRTAVHRLRRDYDEVQGLGRVERNVAALEVFVNERVLSDEETLKLEFESLRNLAREGAIKFEVAAAHFARLGRQAELPEARSLYDKAAEWYRARARRAAEAASLKLPTDSERSRGGSAS